MFKVEDIFLLNKEMFFKFDSIIPPMDAWWLDTPKSSLYKGHFANYMNNVYVCYHGEHTGIGIRPAIKVTGLKAEKMPGEKVKLLGYGSNTWTVLICLNSFTYLLYDEVLQNGFQFAGEDWFDDKLKCWIKNELYSRL